MPWRGASTTNDRHQRASAADFARVSDQPLVGAAVQNDVLARNESCLRAAEIRARIAKLFRTAQTLGRKFRGDLGARFLVGNVLQSHAPLRERVLAVSVETFRQQIVDGD